MLTNQLDVIYLILNYIYFMIIKNFKYSEYKNPLVKKLLFEILINFY